MDSGFQNVGAPKIPYNPMLHHHFHHQICRFCIPFLDLATNSFYSPLEPWPRSSWQVPSWQRQNCSWSAVGPAGLLPALRSEDETTWNGEIRCNIREIISYTNVTESLHFNVPILVGYFRVSSSTFHLMSLVTWWGLGQEARGLPNGRLPSAHWMVVLFWTPDNKKELDPEGETSILTWLSCPF